MGRKRPWYAHGNYWGGNWSDGKNQTSVEGHLNPVDADDAAAKEHDAQYSRRKRAKFGDPGLRNADFKFAAAEWKTGTLRGKIGSIAVGAQGAARAIVGVLTGDDGVSPTNNNMYGDGYKRGKTRTVVKGRKRFNKVKLLSGGIKQHVQCMGLTTANSGTGQDPQFKHLVSEFNPQQCGMVAIPQFSGVSGTNANFNRLTPLQFYDLNHYIFNAKDNIAVWPAVATSQNADINARAWVFCNDNGFRPMRDRDPAVQTINDPRYYISDPRGNELNDSIVPNKRKVYRGGIEIRFVAYGCKAMAMEYEFSIVKMMDAKMCPDYDQNLGGDELREYQHRYQRMIKGWTTNPILQGIEPGPADKVRWYKTIAKKTVVLPEQQNTNEVIPTKEGIIKLRLNELNDHTWGATGISVDTGGAYYDNVPVVNGDINNIFAFKTKPYYTSRYYLRVRARATVDSLGTEDGEVAGASEALNQYFKTNRTNFNFVPTYDVIIKNTYYNTSD